MRKYLLAGAAAFIVATPAAATTDNAGYVGVEGGILFPQSQDIDGQVVFTSTGPVAFTRDDLGSYRYKKGLDLDFIGGYDFGMFRVEGELGYKHSHLSGLRLSSQLLTDLSSASGTTPVLTNGAIDLDTPRATALSGMINGLVDFGADAGIGGYIGAGVGEAHVKRLTDGDTALAWQLIAGVLMPIAANVDAGIKYRYFTTGRLHFDGEFDFGAAEFPYTTAAKFRSHSLLASVIFNFGGRAVEAAPPPPPPPPPPLAAPATQTCPDGSVILATAACPPPAPPPPPPAPVERG